MSIVLDNTHNIHVAQNELVTQHAWNRNFIKLVEIDKLLKEQGDMIKSSINIMDNDPQAIYQPGDAIWYKSQVPGILSGEMNLYLLINLLPDNPGLQENVSPRLFEKLGWKNKYDYKSMLDYGLSSVLTDKVNLRMESHESDELYHPLGRVSEDETDPDYVGNKLLKRDLSNLDQTRKQNFFPHEVKWMTVNAAIVNGFYRIYANKIIEYDIIFKFGASEKSETETIFQAGSNISANTLELKPYTGAGEGFGRQENSNYFKNTWDMQIFKYSEGEIAPATAVMGMLKQANRNDYANTYAAKITFPIQFLNRDYMIYSNMILSQGMGSTVVQSQNDLVFTDKTRSSVIAVNVTYPGRGTADSNMSEYNSKNNGLISNSFHVKIIGRLS